MRCQSRVANGAGHGFTDATATAHIHADFTDGLHDMAERHVLTDPPQGPLA